ncbi:hypothetical protein M422DRAFT_255522 [Sphaerobolus stellatus SS14]|uniref:Uncharacterized protein n=1 Tax=Sphaerobolus stellatus (strain SS14) TaxID=990650 RepID=A0A0C9VSY6_SPHS4|nr:hypothetical protein M422DRAFT_255522 [Sphaerobolus stellatus SS14]
MLNRLNNNLFASKRRSLHCPALDSNLAIIHAESQTLRLEHFKFEQEWQTRTKEMLFYDGYRGEIVEYGFPVFNERILPHCIEIYNDKHHQQFECFCGQYSPSAPVYVKIYTEQVGEEEVAYAACHTCGLSISFNEKYKTAQKETAYPGFHRDSETMPVPSLPETLPRDLVPRKSQSLRLSGLASSLWLYRPQQFHCTRSSIGHAVANPKCLGTPTTFKQVFDESPSSASSLLKCYAGKQTRTQTPSSPSIAGPSHFSGSFEGPSQASSSSSHTIEEDNDVLVYCLSCHRYCALEHFCIKDISPEL